MLREKLKTGGTWSLERESRPRLKVGSGSRRINVPDITFSPTTPIFACYRQQHGKQSVSLLKFWQADFQTCSNLYSLWFASAPQCELCSWSASSSSHLLCSALAPFWNATIIHPTPFVQQASFPLAPKTSRPDKASRMKEFRNQPASQIDLWSPCAFNPSIHHQIPSRIPLINHLISCFVPSLHPIESLIEKLLFIPLSNHHIPMKGQSSICQPCQVNNKERQYREEMNHYSSSPCHAAEM